MTAKNKKITRREFVKQAGLAGAALPFFNILRFNRAEAASAVAPLRLITLWHPWQVPEIYYHPQNASGGMAAAGSLSGMNLNFTNSVLAPLAPFANKMILFRGLGFGQSGVNSHLSNVSVFTGSNSTNVTSDGMPTTTTGSSIEQYLFGRMAQAGSLDPLVIGLQSYIYADHIFDKAISWRKGVAQGMVGNPQTLLANYFGNFKIPTGTTNASDAQLLARRQQIFNVAQNGLNGLLAQISSTTPSGQNLKSHQNALNGLASQLGANNSGVNLGSCRPPTTASIAADTSPDAGKIDNTKLMSDAQSFFNLITQVFACDITRFASLKFSDSGEGSTGDVAVAASTLGVSIPVSDQGKYWHGNVTHPATGLAEPNSVYLAAYKRFWFTQVASLLTTLQSVQDPYNLNQTLFDNTLILIGSEGCIQTANGDPHCNGTQDQPFIVLGGCGGMLNTGQLLDVRSQGKVCTQVGGIANNALLTNIVNAFERNQQAFNPSYSPNILNQFGDYAFPVSATNWLST